MKRQSVHATLNKQGSGLTLKNILNKIGPGPAEKHKVKIGG
jgi:hypothetical protein